jgi:transposase
MSQNDFTISETIQPQEASPMKQEMHVLGIDIAKRVFHAVGMDDTGKVVFRKRMSRHDLMPFIAKLPPVLIGMEACGGAHYWARRFREHHHEVKLMAPQFVKPYIKSNKNDMRDAEGIGGSGDAAHDAFCADEGRRPARPPSAPSGARAPDRGPHGASE